MSDLTANQPDWLQPVSSYLENMGIEFQFGDQTRGIEIGAGENPVSTDLLATSLVGSGNQVLAADARHLPIKDSQFEVAVAHNFVWNQIAHTRYMHEGPAIIHWKPYGPGEHMSAMQIQKQLIDEVFAELDRILKEQSIIFVTFSESEKERTPEKLLFYFQEHVEAAATRGFRAVPISNGSLIYPNSTHQQVCGLMFIRSGCERTLSVPRSVLPPPIEDPATNPIRIFFQYP